MLCCAERKQIVDEELISKKDLLEATGISYGQLYRWKRKNLIPEEWFIKKAVSTGQETFFPKQKILARIDKIKNMKEDVSLNDLADVFSPSAAGLVAAEKRDLARIISGQAMDMLVEETGDKERFSSVEVLAVYAMEKALNSGEAGKDEAKLLLETLLAHYYKYEGKNCSIYLLRKMGVSSCCLAMDAADMQFDKGVKTAVRINLAALTEELKLKF
jgi:hypothetical protein